MRKRIEEKKRLSGMQLAQLINLLIHVSFSFFIILRKSTSIRLRFRVFSHNLKRAAQCTHERTYIIRRMVWPLFVENYIMYINKILGFGGVLYTEHFLSDPFFTFFKFELSCKNFWFHHWVHEVFRVYAGWGRAAPQEGVR